MKYFEDNPEIFAALVAAIAILGGLLGSVIGAKIQAKSGQDQAAAAREAAQIAAEAQRVAALWTVRQIQVAEFIQSAREFERGILDSLSGKNNPFDPAVNNQRNEVRHALLRKQAEIELVAPSSVAEVADAVFQKLDTFENVVNFLWPEAYVTAALNRQVRRDDPAASALAVAARSAVDQWHVAHEANAEDASSKRREAHQALRSAMGLTTEDAEIVLLSIVVLPILSGAREERQNELKELMAALVGAAREMLRSDDDVAPTVPPQRRRWWRMGVA
ncbi:hypothetical protein [Streptomyces sp. NPDC002057]|uniref:hypothetical protein n=1 Tax=Streptomyces sp. NPDC002057 TaxID=3154664 RepID=UPI003329E48F